MNPILTVCIDIFLFFALYVQVLLLFTFLEHRTKIKKDEQEPATLGKYQPSITLLIPVWNEEKSVEGTIRSAMHLKYPTGKLNIVIIDDGSTDATLKIARRFERYQNIKVIHKENGGKHTALNLGIAMAKTDLVGCLDADTYALPCALLEVVRVFERRPDIMAVTAPYRTRNSENILQKMQRVEYNICTFVGAIFGEINALHVASGPFSIFKREVFDKIGMYRKAHNTEDLEIALRMHKHRMPIGYAHCAIVETISPNTLKGLYKQRLRWMYGFLKNAIDYRDMIFNPTYGNMGMIKLPISIFSIFMVLFFAGVGLWSFAQIVFNGVIHYMAVGFKFSFSLDMLDMFFINTTMTAILAYLLLISTVIMIFMGKQMAEHDSRPSWDMAYFIFLYGFFAPVWLFKSVYNVICSKTSSWR